MNGDNRLDPGVTFEVSLHWRLADSKGAWARATFVAQVSALDEARNRLLCELVEIVSLRTSHPPENLDPTVLASIKELVDRYAYLPEEAVNGVTLHLKAATLTDAMNYFFDESPLAGDGGE